MAAENHKVHITLVGGQPYPVYLGIKESSPDKVIMVCSAQSSKDADRIADVAEIDQSSREIVLADPVNIQSVYQVIQEKIINGISPDTEYSVNLTGGTKIWAIALFDLLRGHENVKMFYIDQSNNLYDLSAINQMPSNLSFETDVVFRLNGANAKRYRSLSEYTGEDFSAIKRIEEILEHKQFIPAITALTSPRNFRDRTQIPHHYQNVFNGSFLKYDTDHPHTQHEFGHADLRVSVKGKTHCYTLDAPHLRELLFYAGWFEVLVAHMLSKWKACPDIRLGVLFVYTFTPKALPKNEIDVVMNTGSRLLFVECKTQITNITDIDKFKTVVDYSGGRGSLALFVSYYTMMPTAREKCRDSDVMCFSIEDARQEFWDKQDCDPHRLSGPELKEKENQMNDYVQVKFNELLNNKLRTSNKK